MMLVLNKRQSNRWQAQVSYVLSKSTGTIDNTSSAGVSSRQFETPTLALVNVNGTTTNDRTHEFKVLGGYQIPIIEVAVNAYYRALSGRTFSPYERLSSGVLGPRPRAPGVSRCCCRSAISGCRRKT